MRETNSCKAGEKLSRSPAAAPSWFNSHGAKTHTAKKRPPKKFFFWFRRSVGETLDEERNNTHTHALAV